MVNKIDNQFMKMDDEQTFQNYLQSIINVNVGRMIQYTCQQNVLGGARHISKIIAYLLYISVSLPS